MWIQLVDDRDYNFKLCSICSLSANSSALIQPVIPLYFSQSRRPRLLLKATVSQDFCLGFFHESSSLKHLKITLGLLVSMVPAVNLSTTLVANNGNKIWLLTSYSDFEGKKLFCKLTLLPKGAPKKIIKTFLIGFFHLPPVSTTLVVHLELWISVRIFKKMWYGLNGILRGLGENYSWKNPKVKILVALSL